MQHNSMALLTLGAVMLLFISLNCADINSDSIRSEKGPKEYCNVDTFFEPRCETSQVIFMRSSLYGRMHKGRCINDDFGSIGCSVNTLTILDSMCSGRRSCQVVIPQIERFITTACPMGLRQYLEVDYECVNVAYPLKGYCDSNSPTDVEGHHGFLASLVTQETGCGSMDTPWRVSSEPGRQFRISLWNSHYDDVKNECAAYVLIDETGTETLCATNTRHSPAYISQSNSLELRLMSGTHGGADNGYFIVEFEAFGCKDKNPPENGWVRRIGDTLYHGCNVSNEHVYQWEMQCNGSHWIGAEHNCTMIMTTSMHMPEKSTTPTTTQEPNAVGPDSVMSIIVIAGVAVLVLLCIVLSCMAIYIVRFRKRERDAPRQDIISDYDTDNRRPTNINRTSLKMDGKNRNSSSETDNYWTWQNNQSDQRRNNIPDGPRSQHGTICSMSAHRCQVPEESTMLVRKIDDGNHHRSKDRKATDYDQLDPEFMDTGCVDGENADHTA